jgi:hypothetical protein
MRQVQAMVCAVVLLAGVAARGEWSPPAGTVAFVQADPRGFGPSSTWLASMLRMLSAAGVVRAEDRPVADAVLVATLLGSHPHTLALLDLKAERFVPGDVEIDALQAVVSVAAPGRHGEFRQTLQTVLLHYGKPEARQQTTIDLPGGRQGVRYRLTDWPEWMAIEWAADAQTFTLGVGEGSLQQWFARDDVGDDPRVTPHLQAMAAMPAGNADHALMLRLFADLDQLRASAPTLFATGRLTPLLRAFDLDAAARVALQARWKNTFVVMAGTASSEAEGVTAAELTLDHWPDDAGVAMPPGGFHLVAPMDGPRAAVRLNSLVRILRKDSHWRDYDRFVRDHFGRRLERLTDHVARYRPLLLVSDHPKAWLPVPGTATAYLVLRENEPIAPAAEELQALLAPAIRTPDDPADAVAIVTDPATGVQWLDSPMRALFKSPAWAWQDRVLIASYSPVAVLENRRWLQRQEAHDAQKPEQTQEPTARAD